MNEVIQAEDSMTSGRAIVRQGDLNESQYPHMRPSWLPDGSCRIGVRICILVFCLLMPSMWGQRRNGYFNSGSACPIDQLDYPAFTHITHWAVKPVVSRGSVTLDTAGGRVLQQASQLTSTAHASGVKVLLSVYDNTTNMYAATSATNLPIFVKAIMHLVAFYGYDGVDLDWESRIVDPIRYGNLIAALRKELDLYHPLQGGRGLLTAFVEAPIAAANATSLDQINVGCYDDIDFSFSYIWHNAALYDQANVVKYHTCTNVLQSYIVSGVPKMKLNMGIPFYGWVIAGGADANGVGPAYPRQKLVQTSSTTASQIEFRSIVTDPSLWQVNSMKRDEAAGSVPYLTIGTGAGSKFVTYDDATSIAVKWGNAMSSGLGGVAVWAIGMDYLPGGANYAAQHPLSEALRHAAGK